MQTEHSPEHSISKVPAKSSSINAASVLGVLYLIGAIVCILVMLLTPAPASSLALVVLTIASIGYGVAMLRWLSPRTAVAAAGQAGAPDAPTGTQQVSSPGFLRSFQADLRSNTAVYTPVFTVVAILMMVASGYLFTTYGIDDFPSSAIYTFLVGLLPLGLAVASARPSTAHPLGLVTVAMDSLPRSRRAVAAFISAVAGIGGITFVAAVNGMSPDWGGHALYQVSTHVQFVVFVTSVLLIGWGFGGAPALGRLWQALRGVDRRELLILGLVLAVAFALRMWGVDQTVRGLIDELHFSSGIRYLYGTPDTPLISPMSGQSPFSWLFTYTQAGMVHLQGQSLFSFRSLSPIIGTLTVLAIWGLARYLFDRSTAILAAILLTVFPPHLHFSRLSIIQIADPLFGALALLLIARALQENRRILWSFAGVALGLTQYFYEGARLFYIPLAGVWLVILLVTNYSRIRTYAGGLLVLALTTLIVALPYNYVLVAQEKPVVGRMDDSGLGFRYWNELLAGGLTEDESNEVTRRLSAPFMLYVHRPEAAAWYYGGEHPLVLEPLVPIFLLGAGYVLWHWRRPALIALLWPVCLAVANALFIRDAIVVSRYVDVLPALALLLAVGIRYIPALLLNSARALTQERIPVRLLLAAAVGAICVFQVAYYFGPHLDFYNRQFRNAKPYGDGIDVALRVAELPMETQSIIVGMPEHDQNVPRDFHGFLVFEEKYPMLSFRPDVITPKYLNSLPRDRNYAFFVDLSQTEVVNLIYRYFPDAQAPQYTTTDMLPTKEYVLLFVPAYPYEYFPPVKE